MGVRPPAEVRKLIVGYFFGIGVAFGKHIRTGSRKCVQHFLVSLLFLTRDVLFNFIRGKRPTKAGQLLNFVRGTIASFSMRIDSTTHVFIEQD